MLSSVCGNATTFIGDRTDFRDETIYFVITTRFYDGDKSNNTYCWDGKKNDVDMQDPEWRGDFKGLIEKLDYIKALGFTAIWITPVVENASGFDYHGYHASNFSAVDRRYESEDVKFQDLIDAAHAKGMKVILDIVLNHTGNFGEENLCKLFNRDWSANQSNIYRSMVPFTESMGGKLPDEYADKVEMQYGWRLREMKNTDGVNHDNHNLWHHFAHFNWDEPNRVLGQIAGDCVDLNTENPQVYNYLVDCYGKFIKMGVDGFRIDTSGHIARITFNKAFIPAFHKIADSAEAKAKRGDTPFYMFGEVCARFGGVTYRNQAMLSPYFYTWQSPTSLMSQWNDDPTYWDNLVVKEGEGIDNDNIKLWFTESAFSHNSDNAFLKGNDYHKPDYSEASGFNVIDFPMHYNFNSAGQAVGIAKEGDNLYNDATWNVVYVDSHDYCPGPNDGTRFNGGTAQWAENLSLMFTFRGIPCLYYGSEIEFRKGVTIDKGPELALKNSGRAYFGGYVKGDVTTSDFGEYTATGNAAATLNHDLAQHIRRLNLIRAAVPALRKGQYSWNGCSNGGGYAFKRRYTDGTTDSYALVALNGGSYSFTGVVGGTYTELITGETKTVAKGGVISGTFSGKGNLRVWVLNFTGGKIGEDGKFLYATASSSKGEQTYDGTEEEGDPDCVYDDTPLPKSGIVIDPQGGSFKTDSKTVTITATNCTDAWYKIDEGEKVNFTDVATFTIGAGLPFDTKITVTYGCTLASGAITKTAVFTKKDPASVRTVYFDGPQCKIYTWGGSPKTEEFGAWPGKTLTEKTEEGYYVATIINDDQENIIFHNDSFQTADGKIIDNGIYSTKGFTGEYYGNAKPSISMTPACKFRGTMTVSINVSGATVSYYTINNGAEQIFDKSATFQITKTSVVYVMAVNDNGTVSKTTTYTFTDEPEPEGRKIYFLNNGNWANVYCYVWEPKEFGAWPGKKVTDVTEDGYYYVTITEEDATQVIWNNNSGTQTGNLAIIADEVYNASGDAGYKYGEEPPAPSDKYVVYYNNTENWTNVYCHYWGGSASTNWPGILLTEQTPEGYFIARLQGDDAPTGIIFHDNNNHKAGGGDLVFYNKNVYDFKGNHEEYAGVEQVRVDIEDGMPFKVYDLYGRHVATVTSVRELRGVLARGIYVAKGRKIVF